MRNPIHLRSLALTWLVALAGCDDPPGPDPLAEQVRADVEACRTQRDAWANCGPTVDCLPDINSEDTPFSLLALINCAASVCAGLSGIEGDQCRFEAALFPGGVCEEAKRLCERGDEPELWLSAQ